jgi:hypothetical protein
MACCIGQGSTKLEIMLSATLPSSENVEQHPPFPPRAFSSVLLSKSTPTSPCQRPSKGLGHPQHALDGVPATALLRWSQVEPLHSRSNHHCTGLVILEGPACKVLLPTSFRVLPLAVRASSSPRWHLQRQRRHKRGGISQRTRSGSCVGVVCTFHRTPSPAWPALYIVLGEDSQAL